MYVLTRLYNIFLLCDYCIQYTGLPRSNPTDHMVWESEDVQQSTMKDLIRVDVSPTDVSPTENSWMLRPLNKASLGYCVPDQCVPTLD